MTLSYKINSVVAARKELDRLLADDDIEEFVFSADSDEMHHSYTSLFIQGDHFVSLWGDGHVHFDFRLTPAQAGTLASSQQLHDGPLHIQYRRDDGPGGGGSLQMQYHNSVCVRELTYEGVGRFFGCIRRIAEGRCAAEVAPQTA